MAMNCLNIGCKEWLVTRGCGLIGALAAAALGDHRLQRRHLQQTFAAPGDAETACFSPAKGDAGIGGGDDQVVDEHSTNREPRGQGTRLSLGPEDSRSERIRAA